MRRSMTAALSALTLTAVAALGGVGAVGAAADPAAPSVPQLPPEALAALRTAEATGPGHTAPPGLLGPALLEADGAVTAFVQLDAPSALDVVEEGGSANAAGEAAARVTAIAEDLLPHNARTARARSNAPQRLTVTSNLVAGMVVTGDAEQVRSLAQADEVLAVHLITPKTQSNDGTDAFTRAAQVWQDYGQTGEGVRIGVIDTGVDYTHATFGGPGTVEAYTAAYGENGTGPVPEDLFDGTKYLGGYDFVGPDYDASGTIPGTTPVPQPDENPIDAHYSGESSGHGTHVAGTAAGYGVTADGETFRGDYGDVADVADWQVGPGSAPDAGIYALKVFGDQGGATAAVIEALEWAADPDGDLDFSDRLDVVNLSLGGAADPADDPENLFVDRLSDLGTLSVMAAGNDGDATDVGGSPGNARSALAVANSVGDTMTFDAIEVTAAQDESLLGRHPMQNTIFYAGGEDAAGPVVHLGADVDGCAPLTPYAEEVAGAIVWLHWDDSDATRACGSGVRWANATAAGAAGVLIGTSEPIFSAAIAGDAQTPGGQLTATTTELLLPEIAAGTLEVRVGPSLTGAQLITDASVADTLNPSSSRGAHGSLGVVKPDVAAPGTAISSAAAGAGSGAHTLTGTSMAAPHVAGIAALVRAENPSWSPVQAKAAIMNTAVNEVFSDPGPDGPHYGPERVGAGRVDGHDAVTADVIAYDSEAPELVSVGFGIVDVGAEPVVMRRTITVENLSARGPVRFQPRFEAATTAGGATIDVSPASITVAPGRPETVTVTLTADPATLVREIDPTSSTDSGLGVPREFVAALSGQVVLAPRAVGAELHVPVHAAPRLVSDLSTEPVDFPTADALAVPLEITGRAVDSGGWTSRVAALELVATSPRIDVDPGIVTSPTQVAAGDIRYVGMGSTAPQLVEAGFDPSFGVLGIGIAMDGQWPTLGTTTLPVIDIDVDSDGTPDLQAVVQKLAVTVDVTLVTVFDHATGQPLAQVPVNGLWGDVDTTVFDNDVLIAPIPLALLDPTVVPTFSVWTYSPYAPSGNGVVDVLEPVRYDPFAPALWTTGGDLGDVWHPASTPLTVHRAPAATEPGPLLVLHSHNTEGQRARVVEVSAPEVAPVPSTTSLRVADRIGSYGTSTTAQVTVVGQGAAPSGTVEIRAGSRVVATGELSVEDQRGQVSVELPSSLAAGSHRLTAVYLGSPLVEGSSSSAVSYLVLPALATVEINAQSLRVPRGTAPEVTIEVSPRRGGPVPTGTVTVTAGLRKVTTVTLDENGSATVTLPQISRTTVVTAIYSGDAGYLPSLDVAALRAG